MLMANEHQEGNAQMSTCMLVYSSTRFMWLSTMCGYKKNSGWSQCKNQLLIHCQPIPIKVVNLGKKQIKTSQSEQELVSN